MDYNDILKLANTLYYVSTNDFYPNLMNPSLMVSNYYFLYHIPFTVLFLLILQPIPVSLILILFFFFKKIFLF